MVPVVGKGWGPGVMEMGVSLSLGTPGAPGHRVMSSVSPQSGSCLADTKRG